MLHLKFQYYILIPLIFIVQVNGAAQNYSYKQAMNNQLSAFKTAKGVNDIQKLADAFSSIAITEKKEWLPYYYASLCNVLVAFEKKESEIVVFCDKAERLVKKADSLESYNSEISVLKSMICAARIAASETLRTLKYGSQSLKYANEAVKLNTNNPRAYLVKAQNIFHMPEIFGGGAKNAKPILELALEKEKQFKTQSTFHPNWSKTEIENEIKKVNKSLLKK